MSSILKVDQLQDSGGNAIITSDGSGNVTQSKAGITMADQWRLTSDITADTDPISSNLEQVDTSGQGTLGSAMTVSSGRFTFPQTGIYLVRFNAYVVSDSNGDNIRIFVRATTDNLNYTDLAQAYEGASNERHMHLSAESLVDVTDTTNVKVSFGVSSVDSGSILQGETNRNSSYFTFLRLGDT